MTLALNIPFLLMGMRKLGTKFIVKSADAMVAFSSFLKIFTHIVDLTHKYLLAGCFGGVFLGVGFVARAGGCLDGTETVTILEGAGLISGKKTVLYCALNRFEIYELKRLIKDVDTSAFITISGVAEIIGSHIITPAFLSLL